jgi:hypothetical protein
VEEGRDKRSDCKSAIKDPSRLRVPAEQPPHTHRSVRDISRSRYIPSLSWQTIGAHIVLHARKMTHSTSVSCFSHLAMRSNRSLRTYAGGTNADVGDCVAFIKPCRLRQPTFIANATHNSPASATTVQFNLLSFVCSLRLSRACVGKSSCFTAPKSPKELEKSQQRDDVSHLQ